MKKIKMFGKTIPLALLVGILVIGVGSAAILEYYGTITGTAEVEQSVILVGCEDNECTYEIGDSPTIAGSTYVHTQTVSNKANQQVPIDFVTTVEKCSGSGYATCTPDNGNVLTTRYYGILELENKDITTWVAIPDSTNATLKYDLVSSKFNYKLEANGLQADTSYSLVYYADKQDRFVNWGGDNPGVLITTATSDGTGYLFTQGDTNLNINLPHTNDWNLAPNPDYCANNNGFDSYNLCGGAKIWLVPSSEYDTNTKTVSWTTPTSYLFETDMIDYSDIEQGGDDFNMNPGNLTLNIENTFNPATEPGFYKITTKVVPA